MNTMRSNFEDLVIDGLKLLRYEHVSNAITAHCYFLSWVDEVYDRLVLIYPNSGVSIKWTALPGSNLASGEGYCYGQSPYASFRHAVQTRLNWLSELVDKDSNKPVSHGAAKYYVSPERLVDLNDHKSLSYDLSKLIRLCEELNICFNNECYLSVSMLMRAVIDHVPPIFSMKNFDEVTNNYNGGTSFKKVMKKLNSDMREIANLHLHTQIKEYCSLPNAVQIDFSNALDVLLAQIVSIIKSSSK